jgi:hypothetical protein
MDCLASAIIMMHYSADYSKRFSTKNGASIFQDGLPDEQGRRREDHLQGGCSQADPGVQGWRQLEIFEGRYRWMD